MADKTTSTKTDVTLVEETDVSFVVAVFDDVSTAKTAFNLLKDLKREGFFDINAAAYMEKTERSKLKMHEYKDWSGKKGALAGGALGSIVGIIGGAVLLPLSIGALIGGIFSKVHDTGFNNKDLREMADALPAGTSALIAIVEETSVKPVEEELKKAGGKKIYDGDIPKSAYMPMAEAQMS